MKWSEFFQSAITGAREAGIVIEADAVTAQPIAAELVSQQVQQAQADPKLAEALAAAQQQIAKLEADAQGARFAALIERGPSGRWAGDASAHMQILRALGDESGAPFQAYVSQQNAHAEQLRQSALFTNVGSSQPGGASAWAQIETKAAQLMAASPRMTKAQAIVAVAESAPALYAQYQAEK